jgi:hypothetical protein
MIKNEEYEKAYSDAREVLYNRGKKISRPLCGAGRVRYCLVDGFPLTDRELLKEAWGESLADEILVELAESHSVPGCCQKGNRLWHQYSRSTRLNLKILIAKELAASRQDDATIAQLASKLLQAVDSRRQTRRSLLDHAAMHATAQRAYACTPFGPPERIQISGLNQVERAAT